MPTQWNNERPLHYTHTHTHQVEKKIVAWQVNVEKGGKYRKNSFFVVKLATIDQERINFFHKVCDCSL